MNGIPVFETRHRMKLALEYASVPVHVMARELGVNRSTIGRYLNGSTTPPHAVLIVWSQKCGVTLDWLINGPTS